MKKVFFAIGLMAAMVAVSCNKQLSTEVSEEPEYYEVKLGMSGAITSEIVPLTKSGENDQLIGINVYSCPVDGSTYSHYAYGLFDVNDITVRLVSGYKYKFDARVAFDCKSLLCVGSDENGEAYIGPFTTRRQVSNFKTYLNNEFIFDVDSYIFDRSDIYPIELYYGEVEGFVPSKDASVTIDMERSSFGLSITAENIADGCFVNVEIGDSNYKFLNISLTPENSSYYNVFNMSLFSAAVNNPKSFGSEKQTITVSLTSADNVTTPLGSSQITFSINKLTKIKINAAAPLFENGLAFTYSSDEIVDDGSNSYEIGGGEVYITPVE